MKIKGFKDYTIDDYCIKVERKEIEEFKKVIDNVKKEYKLDIKNKSDLCLAYRQGYMIDSLLGFETEAFILDNNLIKNKRINVVYYNNLLNYYYIVDLIDYKSIERDSYYLRLLKYKRFVNILLDCHSIEYKYDCHIKEFGCYYSDGEGLTKAYDELKEFNAF